MNHGFTTGVATCGICGKQVPDNDALVVHMRVHGNPKKLYEHKRLTVEDNGASLTFLVADAAELLEVDVEELLRVLEQWRLERWRNRATPPR